MWSHFKNDNFPAQSCIRYPYPKSRPMGTDRVLVRPRTVPVGSGLDFESHGFRYGSGSEVDHSGFSVKLVVHPSIGLN